MGNTKCPSTFLKVLLVQLSIPTPLLKWDMIITAMEIPKFHKTLSPFRTVLTRGWAWIMEIATNLRVVVLPPAQFLSHNQSREIRLIKTRLVTLNLK
jgi:hypothetical protein